MITIMFDISFFLKSICCKRVIIPNDIEYTLEEYTRMVIQNFNDIQSIEVDKNIKLLKKKIKLFLTNNYKYMNYDIKISPIHKTDNLQSDENYVYIAIGIFYINKNIKYNPFCFDRIILKIQDNTIIIQNKRKINKYINKKNILS